MSVLDEIQKWYASNCNGDWEHGYGVEIETLDNPGWFVKIDLEETNLHGKSFEKFEKELSDEIWIHCRVEDNKFLGFGDEYKLEEILKVFLDWAKSQSEDWLKPLSEEELQSLEDERFLKLLGEEIGTQLCKSEGCTHKRIKNSVLCRKHHFESVEKRPFPEHAS
ncbi:MAG: immunity 53 family protein [Acidobacteriota bacterium]|nr:immunity 53 family protein [Acidobacteriota bacterium]